LSLEIGKRCLKNRYIFRELEERKENKFTLWLSKEESQNSRRDDKFHNLPYK
jgi:hypothetical protein